MKAANGRDLLNALKSAAGVPGPQMVLQVGIPAIATLRTVATRPEMQSTEDIRCLTQWRNVFVTSFLTEFTATEAQTSRWLANTVGSDQGRILFMVDDATGVTVGYTGLAFIDWMNGYGEADSVVRGKEARAGLMTEALHVLFGWARGQLGLSRLGVRVRSDNPALSFYRKLGFVETKRVPLSHRKEVSRVVWYEDPKNVSATVSLVHHQFQ